VVVGRYHSIDVEIGVDAEEPAREDDGCPLIAFVEALCGRKLE